MGNAAYARVLREVGMDVKGGLSISDALDRHAEIPGIMVAMTKVGEETGELGKILITLAKFYNREVTNAVDTPRGTHRANHDCASGSCGRYTACRGLIAYL